MHVGQLSKNNGKVHHTPLESVSGCSSPSSRPWVRRWRSNNVCWRVASATPDLPLLSQPQGITAS